jgi:NNP family nitrate/nitrite transporter-like MFS transporter
MSEVESGEPAPIKKYSTYSVSVDPAQDDRATEIKMCSFARPHMRAFHYSWWGFFIAFFIWFAIAPLLSEIKETLKLSKEEVWTSSITGVAGTIFMRFMLGPLCDKYGARIPFCIILCTASIPTAMTGLVESATGLAIIRLFIGIAGSTFVMCQYWSSRMFAKEVVGTANAITAGWGNLGGGVTQLVMGSALFPLFKVIYGDDENGTEKAWRTVSVIPAVVAFASGIMILTTADDCPKGDYKEMKKLGTMAEVSASNSFRAGAMNLNTWLLFLQYACCFGVELTMNNAAALYFKEEFDQSTESAAAIASIFGWMNLFARGVGGFCSDKANAKLGMRGRLLAQTIFLAAEGALVLIFAGSSSLAGAIIIMIFFSMFVQAAEGSSYGIVPYVDPPNTGSIAGIIGAGGNTGAVGFGLGFRQLDYKEAFYLMGGTILATSFLSIFVHIPGHSGLLWGQEDLSKQNFKQTLEVPEPDEELVEPEEMVEPEEEK